MNCQDFDRLWNELLDSTRANDPAVAEALRVHAEACPACQARGASYERLRQAIATLGSAAVPSDGWRARVLAEYRAQQQARPVVIRLRRAGWLSAAAALMVAGLLALRGGLGGRHAPDSAGSPRPLNVALVDATSATLALARDTSLSAARLGDEVLDETVPSIRLPDPVAPSAEALKGLGNRIATGVRPLSGSARHAFSFLLEPALGTKDEPAPPAPPKPPSGA